MRVAVPSQKEIIEHYGVEKQTVIWMEELSELTKAASKCLRNYNDLDYEYVGNLAEEIADVIICIEQMRVVYSIPQNLIQGIILEKYERQLNRMEFESK